ncbi:MAG: ABC-F family ATP-binding cassette domain-containing protein [Candidatus Cryptobacteroides sp.]|nr:ABC-F family ATP-binding cassette domain-containing protein [Bacteroidales bacterium]MCI7748880.1 ABC-F family ATP-binding cassette domain-containing protein [Bacteroidales bacterium]MDY4631653.1 ABC-F family ATP-binding cassette domain-containing protein [Candidatus Cryptobacteroides sp.]
MASYLEISNISKSYGPKVLFENIGFNINEGDKIALIAPNGTGKTSLMKILAGKDKSDSGGRIMFLRDVRIAFLEQEYDFDPEKEIFRQVMDGSRQYTEGLDLEHLWEYERRVKEFLTDFKLGDGSRKMKELSGGEVKRVALTQMLASEADFFIMDEPTNHLDIDAIEYLESFLSRSRCTLFMVTHDRYFLDRVCNTVMEMERGNIYIYKGNYQNFLEKREERIANWNAETDKVRNILRRELEWIHATPCARTGKAKYRIDAFHELKERAGQSIQSRQLDLGDMSDRGARRLGTKIIDCTDLSFHYDGNCYLDHFSYKFQRGEKVGIVGANGAGKTTFINLLLEGNRWGGEMSGSIERGESLKIGYYRQEGMVFDEDQTVLETVNDSYLLGRFLFPHDMYNSKVGSLSGGEKRRLYLLTILREQPNMLVLDEPTNDLDIVTLNVLEEYLKEFKGSLIIVSHDRHFLDRLVDHLFVFCGNGVVKDFIGNYSEYRSFIKDYRKEQAAAAKELSVRGEGKTKTEKVRRLSWKEQREMESLEAEIEALNAEKASLEESLSSGTLGTEELMKASERIGEVIKLCDEKEMRWLELSEIGQ